MYICTYIAKIFNKNVVGSYLRMYILIINYGKQLLIKSRVDNREEGVELAYTTSKMIV